MVNYRGLVLYNYNLNKDILIAIINEKMTKNIIYFCYNELPIMFRARTIDLRNIDSNILIYSSALYAKIKQIT